MSQPVTEPPLTGADLNRALIDASLELVAALRARPRDEERLAAAQTAYDELKAQKAVAGG